RSHGLSAGELGLPAYQHPKRHRDYFDQRLDHFAGLVILLSLASVNADLWRRYHTDDNCLLVNGRDLRDPDQSALFAELAQSPFAPIRKLSLMVKAAAQG